MLTNLGIHPAELRSSLRTFASKFFFTEEIEINDRVAITLIKIVLSMGRNSNKPERINNYL